MRGWLKEGLTCASNRIMVILDIIELQAPQRLLKKPWNPEIDTALFKFPHSAALFPLAGVRDFGTMALSDRGSVSSTI